MCILFTNTKYFHILLFSTKVIGPCRFVQPRSRTMRATPVSEKIESQILINSKCVYCLPIQNIFIFYCLVQKSLIIIVLGT